MTTPDLLARAQSTYPPTCIGLRTVCKRIGTASQIADELRLGDHGGRTVRKWISDPRKVPFSVWFALLAIDEDAHAANDSQVDRATISAVMSELASRNKGIPKPKSAENGKKGGRPKGTKNKVKNA